MKWIRYSYNGEDRFICERCHSEFRCFLKSCPVCGASCDGIKNSDPEEKEVILSDN